MQNEYETMKECRHPRCIYRSTINSGRIDVCTYTLQTGKSRNCKISECDKYKDGLKKKPTMTKEGYIKWVVELYEK